VRRFRSDHEGEVFYDASAQLEVAIDTHQLASEN
jgi:hypothetical protein